MSDPDPPNLEAVAVPGEPPSCDFCGSPEVEVGPLLRGPVLAQRGIKDQASNICGSCIQIGFQVLTTARRARSLAKTIPTPRKVYSKLDAWIVGQDLAKRVLSVAVVNHLKRIKARDGGLDGTSSGVSMGKSNVLLIGPTGVGKTALVKALARSLNISLAIGDATTLTETGYVGDDVESLISQLVREADDDLELAQRGIVYIDEIDKIRRRGGNLSNRRDVSGEGVQQALLKLIEGTVADLSPQGGWKHPEQQCLQVDTTNILFICGGSFDGLEEIIARRVGRRTFGFGQGAAGIGDEQGNLLGRVTPEDLIEFGLIPELVGRLPVIAALDDLTEADLVRVLTVPEDALVKQYQALFALEGRGLKFTEDACSEIARRAMALGTGARGLRAVLEEVLLNLQFRLPDRPQGETIMITGAYVRGRGEIAVRPPHPLRKRMSDIIAKKRMKER